MNLRLIAGVCSALVAIGGFAGRIAAICRRAEKDSAFMVAIARIGSDNGSQLTSNAILNLG
jgi:hypothetical protein